jgi:hypothetical protein
MDVDFKGAKLKNARFHSNGKVWFGRLKEDYKYNADIIFKAGEWLEFYDNGQVRY